MSPQPSSERWPRFGPGSRGSREGDDLRAADADRDRTAEVLRAAAGDGRLTITELEERLEQTYTAKTYAELARVTADLPEDAAPAFGGQATPADLTRPGPSEINAFLSEQKVTGRWLVPRQLSARAVMGSVTLDFTEAALPHEVQIDVQVLLGELKLIVPDDIAVVMDTTAFLSETKNTAPGEYAPGTPVLRVRGPVVLGEVTARPPKKKWWFGKRR